MKFVQIYRNYTETVAGQFLPATAAPGLKWLTQEPFFYTTLYFFISFCNQCFPCAGQRIVLVTN